jgi:hypothetical protein
MAGEIIQWSPNYRANQRFEVHPVAGMEYVTIRDAAKGRCLDVKGASTKPGTPVIAWEPNGRANQMWRIVEEANGLCSIHSALDDNLVLDITGGVKAPGTPACVWTPTGALNQRFVRVPAGSGSQFLLAAHSLLPLDVSGG